MLIARRRLRRLKLNELEEVYSDIRGSLCGRDSIGVCHPRRAVSVRIPEGQPSPPQSTSPSVLVIQYAGQPLPGSLTGKQIGLELLDMLLLGVLTAALYRK